MLAILGPMRGDGVSGQHQIALLAQVELAGRRPVQRVRLLRRTSGARIRRSMYGRRQGHRGASGPGRNRIGGCWAWGDPHFLATTSKVGLQNASFRK